MMHHTSLLNWFIGCGMFTTVACQQSAQIYTSTFMREKDEADSMRQKLGETNEGIPQKQYNNPAMMIFDLITSNNNILTGDLRENMMYTAPQNVEYCADYFKQDNQSAYFLTNPPPSEPSITYPTVGYGGAFTYLSYKESSIWGRMLQTRVDQVDIIFTKLFSNGFFNMLGDYQPYVMFDLDNTLIYTAFNDTDIIGKAPPMKAAVDFVKKWCKNWGSRGTYAMFECVFITARPCTALYAKATYVWVSENFPDAKHKHIMRNVQLSGALKCSCCSPQGNIAYKDILRKARADNDKAFWIASIGDQYTDSTGYHSGIRIKFPNVWLDSSVVPNQASGGAHVPLVDGQIHSKDWATHCYTDSLAPIAPGPPSCFPSDAVAFAVEHSTLDYCLGQNVRSGATNQRAGCVVDISTRERECAR